MKEARCKRMHVVYIGHLCIEKAGEIRIFFVEIYTHIYVEEG